MYYLDKYSVTIDIKLEPGIYVFDNQSATGKTRLAKLLSEYQAYKEPVVSYTYNDKLKGISLTDYLKGNEYKVILLDRYDLYNGDYAETIMQYSNEAVILIDCKSEVKNIADDDWCTIVMNQDRIEVVQ